MTASRRPGVALAIAVGVLLLAAWLHPPAAAAVICAPPEAELDFNDPGTAVNASAGFKENTGPANDMVGGRARGTDADGHPVTSGSTCGGSDSWSLMTIKLGDRSDRGRLDAIHPNVFSFDPVPSSVEIVLDGGGGDDKLFGHPGPDTLLGRGGGDILDAADGDADTLRCGNGHDRARVDRHKDTRTGCEDVAFG